MEILFAQLIMSPAATEQRQIDVALSSYCWTPNKVAATLLVWRGRGSNPWPPGCEGGRSTHWANSYAVLSWKGRIALKEFPTLMSL